MTGIGQGTLQFCVHLLLQAAQHIGVARDQPGPPGERGGAGFVTGLKHHHGLVVHLLWAQALLRVLWVAGLQQRAQQIGRLGLRRGFGTLERNLVGDQLVEPDLRAARPLHTGPGKPRGQQPGAKHLRVALGAQSVNGLAHPRAVDLAGVAKQGAHDHVHRHTGHQGVHIVRGVVWLRVQPAQRAVASVHHVAGVGVHPLGRKAGLQQPPLALPLRAFGHQHTVSPHAHGKDRPDPFPALQLVGLIHQQLAHHVGVKHMHRAAPQYVHSASVGALVTHLGQRVEVIVAHGLQKPEARGYAGRAGRTQVRCVERV